ncbi:sigma-54-dependent transcriptional regulator [Haloferula sargassicola]|uniref:DNA-binding transcriptional regulator NtrC n=1 Tax=Haloferula sargassicola TaxID=490096 RepID=A0ABP9UQ54_9BACT
MATQEQTILLVDQDHDFLDWATKHLTADGVRILRCDNSDNAVKVVAKTEIDVVIADLQLQPFDGMELLGKIRLTSPETLVILTAGFPSTGQVIEATQQGAHDVMRKEALPFELRPVVENALQVAEDRRGAEHRESEPQATDARVKIIGVSRALQDVFKIVGRVARSDAPVLVTGESGSGKELVATAVHEYSPRRQREFLAINCGAIPENLLESELFGHEKGAFTGAIAKREGRFEQADGGTLFLDEIGEMPLSVQVKLLRVLQDGTFSRVGSNETIKADARIVAATNKNLAEEVSAGRFREDLYYRLNVVEVKLPALRERPEDIPLLAEFFLQKITRKNGMARIRLSSEAISSLQAHHWPGNVRELENTIARACALASSNVLLPADLPLAVAPEQINGLNKAIDSLLDRMPSQGGYKWLQEMIASRALERNDGDFKKASKILGLTQASFREWNSQA